MRKFLAHTDLTSPDKYNNMINFRNSISVEESQELKQTFGCVKIVGNFKVNLTLLNTFELEDIYGNVLYMAKYNKKDKIFNLIDSNDFQLCSSMEEFDNIIRTTFNRKLRKWN